MLHLLRGMERSSADTRAVNRLLSLCAEGTLPSLKKISVEVDAGNLPELIGWKGASAVFLDLSCETLADGEAFLEAMFARDWRGELYLGELFTRLLREGRSLTIDLVSAPLPASLLARIPDGSLDTLVCGPGIVHCPTGRPPSKRCGR